MYSTKLFFSVAVIFSLGYAVKLIHVLSEFIVILAHNGHAVLFSNDQNLCSKAIINGVKAFNHQVGTQFILCGLYTWRGTATHSRQV